MKDSSSYDVNGNRINTISYNYNNNIKTISGKSEYTFNLSNTITDLINQYSITLHMPILNSVNILTLEKTYEGANFDLAETITYYYSENTTNSIMELKKDLINIYPVIFTDIINISNVSSTHYSFELYDTRGAKVFFKELKDNTQISIPNLSSGIYLYNIISNGKNQSGKLIKK